MKNNMAKIFIGLFFSIFFSSCNTYYFAFDGEIGYSDISLGGDKIEITYVASEKFNVTQAKQCAIFRAAEIASNKGFSYIKIVNTSERIRKKQNATEAKKVITERKDSLGNKSVEYKEIPSIITNTSQIEVTMTFIMSNDADGDAISVPDIKKQLDSILGRK